MSKSKDPVAGSTDREVAALDALEKLREEMIGKLPESIFVKKFLPLFASQEQNVDISEWLNVCHNAYLPVDIVSGNEVLFRVPSLVKQIPTKVSRRGQDSVYEMMETVVKKTAINPNLGKNYLDRQLDIRIQRLGITPEEVKVWNEIFSRYGYQPLANTVTAEPVSTGSKEDLFSDGFDPL